MRDYTSREIDSRQALMLALKSSIIPDLAKIKVSQPCPVVRGPGMIEAK